MNNTKHTNYNSLYQRLLKEPNLPAKLIKIAKESNYPIFTSNKAYPINLNIWGIRSNNRDTKHLFISFSNNFLFFGLNLLRGSFL